MEQWLRDALAEEQGYIICPLASETYTICNEKCEEMRKREIRMKEISEELDGTCCLMMRKRKIREE